jgi:hypothetical protein
MGHLMYGNISIHLLHIIISTELRGVEVQEPIAMKLVLRFIPLVFGL